MADTNTMGRAIRGLGSTLVRARRLAGRARLDFGHAHEPRQRALTALIAAALVCGLLALLLASWGDGPAALDYLEAPLRTAQVRLLTPEGRDADILVIAIDERALAYGDNPGFFSDHTQDGGRYAWPWPRHVYNKLIRWARVGGARVVVLDLTFSESGPNTNDPMRHVQLDGRTLRIWTPDRAGDDLFALEATARPDVCLAVTLDTRPRDREKRDELLTTYAAALEGETQVLLSRLEGPMSRFRSAGAPFPALLEGFPSVASADEPDAARREDAYDFYRMLAKELRAVRFAGLLPLAVPRFQGVGGAGVVVVDREPEDGVTRRYYPLALHDGLALRHLALEAWRLYVLSHAREAAGQPALRPAFHERFRGLDVSENSLLHDGRTYDLAYELRDVPIRFKNNSLHYLARSIPLDESGRFGLRYRRPLREQEDPLWHAADEALRDELSQVYVHGVTALYPTVSAADVLRDWDAWSWMNGGHARHQEELTVSIAQLRAELPDLDNLEQTRARHALASLQTRLESLPRPDIFLRLGQPETLAKDKVVIIAGVAPGLSDLASTPWSQETPASYILATAFDNLKNERFQAKVPQIATWVATLLAAVLAVGGVVFARLARFGLVWDGALALLILLSGALAFTQGVYFHLAGPLAGVLLGLTGGALARALTEGRQRHRREEFARQYMGRELVEHVIRNPDALALGGENREMSVMFSDVAGFTTVTETLGVEKPERLVRLLNLYLERMTEVIQETGGVIDKYIGDAIMCFWGAPVSQPDHALRACRAALHCRAELARMQPVFANAVRDVAPGLIRADSSVLYARVGINTGLMTVGNMGSSRRFAYTVMGDAVNLAARLEPQNKEYGTGILLGEQTAQAVRSDFTIRPLDLVVVKGKSRPVELYELLGERDAPEFIQDLAREFTRGVKLFRARQFRAALEIFQGTAALESVNGAGSPHPSGIYIARCHELIAGPPPEEWTGVYIKASK
jgi:class 3 adenylate cyclase